jgi:hypothetical protein
MAVCGRPQRGFNESVRTALDFLGNPRKLWDSERIEHKRTVLKLAFGDRLAYVRNEGFRTANLALPFSGNTRAIPTILGPVVLIRRPLSSVYNHVNTTSP